MKLAAVGSNCIDFYNNIENGKAYPGGSPVNMAVYTVRLGGEASYTGPVGDDVYGKNHAGGHCGQGCGYLPSARQTRQDRRLSGGAAGG